MRRVTLALVICLSMATNIFAATNQEMTSEQSKQLVKDAVSYALENMDPAMDYSKYVSPDFINLIDGNRFTYPQWVEHQKHIKKMVKSMRPTFDLLVAEGDQVAAIFRIHIVKKDGSELEVKDMGFFKIKNHKFVYVEELTRLVSGDQKNKDIGSTK